MNLLHIGGLEIEVQRKDIKNLNLAVLPPDGLVRISAPLTLQDEAVRMFAISKLSWIKSQQRAFRAQERETLREYVSGESHYLFGRRYLLDIEQSESQPCITVQHQRIRMRIHPDTPTKAREAMMNRWYRRQLKKEITIRLEKWQERTGLQVADWGVKLMKTKWGSCNIEARRIWLNLELAKKPVQCLEYVIVHELAHLLERNHNDRFRQHLDTFLPKWRQYRDELNALPISYWDWEK